MQTDMLNSMQQTASGDAAQNRTAAANIVRCLVESGIDLAFGMPGHTNVALLNELNDHHIRLISTRHEQVAAHAADVHYRLTGRPAALLLHVGPGLTNALTGFGDALADGSAIVAIAGDVAAKHQGSDAFQELGTNSDAGQYSLASALSKRTWRIDRPDGVARHMTRAIRLATSGRPGPVLLSVAMDVFSQYDNDTNSYQSGAAPTPYGPAEKTAIARAVELIATSSRVVLLAGGGAKNAGPRLAQMAELLGVPVVTTLSGRGSVNEQSGLSLGTIGRTGSTAANRACCEADLVLAVGTQFPEQDSSSWARGRTFDFETTRLIHLDIDPRQLGKIYPPAVALLGDAGATLEVMSALLEVRKAKEDISRKKWLHSLQQEHKEWRHRSLSVDPSSPAYVHPGAVLRALEKLHVAGSPVLGDVGWGKNGTSQYFRVAAGNDFVIASGFGTMGFSASGVIGAALARPDLPAIAITGDGGISSCFSAVMTAVEHGLNAKWIVLNNGVYQSILGLQRKHFGRSAGTVFGEGLEGYRRTNFAAMAQAAGATGVQLEGGGDIQGQLERFMQLEGPALLDIPSDPEAHPPSSGYWDVHDMYSPKVKA